MGALLTPGAARSQAGWASAGRQADYVVQNFRFTTGETLPEPRIHYTALGQPRKKARASSEPGDGLKARFPSADDSVNPPELGLAEKYAAMMPNTKFILLPITPDTRGHGTHSLPKIWSAHLSEFLSKLKER
ncbi:MAG: hypothetical protein ACO1Q7_10650 [Gemmatimonas sp.]